MKKIRSALLIAIGATLAAEAAAPTRRDVGRTNDPVYEKECGSCHFAYQPGWLPERSWRRLMSSASLRQHFGENAEPKVGAREAIESYLVAGAADRATNQRSREVMEAIQPGETPVSITRVLYVGGIHGGFLDPAFKGQPAVKTLAECPVCHERAATGWFSRVTYTITDEAFRTDDVDLSASMPVPEWLRPKKK